MTAGALVVLAGVGFAISAALSHSVNPPDVEIPPASTTLGAHAKVPVGYSLPTLTSSARRSLSAELAGRPGVINFFASWCPACQAELAVFGATASHFGHAVAFVGIDTDDSAPGVAATLARNAGVAYPLLLRIGSGTVAAVYGVNHLPTTFIVGADGRIRAELPGTATEAELERILDPLTKPAAQ